VTGFKLRDYQRETIDKLVSRWAERGETAQNRLGVVLPTGMGKTVIFAHLAHEWITGHPTGGRKSELGGDGSGYVPPRVLILVHRDELVKQTVAKVHGVAPKTSIGVVKAERNEHTASIVVASVQTLSRESRLTQIAADAFDMIVVDEAHHAVAESYQRILRYFGAFEPDGATPVAGFTATMGRADKGKLGDVWQDVVIRKDILYGIRKGYLVDVKAKAVPIPELDLDDVRRTGGDFQDGALGDALADAHAAEVIADAWLEHAADRSTVAFMPTVATAIELCDAFNENGIKAEFVTGETPSAERDEIYARVTNGVTRVLCNCMVLTEGFDLPRLACAIIGRLTQSAELYIQMVGRILRPAGEFGKRDALVLDVMGVTRKHRLASIVDLSETVATVEDDESLGDAADREDDEKADRESRPKTINRKKIEVEDVDLFAARPKLWLRTAKGYWFIPCAEWDVVIFPEDDSYRTYMAGRVYTGKGPKRKGVRIIDGVPLEYAMVHAESEADEIDPSTIANRAATWRKRKSPATTAQLGFLAQLGVPIDPDDTPSRSAASDMISVVLASRRHDGYVVPRATGSAA
jgi:ATP-dependent helicase IRC3